jgi:hypothetical protein
VIDGDAPDGDARVAADVRSGAAAMAGLPTAYRPLGELAGDICLARIAGGPVGDVSALPVPLRCDAPPDLRPAEASGRSVRERSRRASGLTRSG